jgi:small-conductance mechanosensitive channel
MTKHTLLAVTCAALLSGATGSLLYAQDSQMAYAETSGKEAPPAPKKPKKVWTDDNVATVRTAADNYADEKAAAAEAAAAVAAKEQQEKAAKSAPKVGKAPALSNPKSTGDADKMVAWEDRDLAAQQEYVDKLRTQIAQAPPEDKERLQKLLQERLKIIEDVKKERNDLVTQKKELEKKAVAAANTDGSAPQAH